MKAETLKKAILQYAMQGKLVEQDPNDEPASVLLERIKAEKEQLIKDGKILKKKSLEPFSNDVIPFEIPKSWEWVYLSDVSIIQEGAGIRSYQYRDSGTQLLTVTNILEGGIDLQKSTKFVDTNEYLEKYKHLTPQIGDIVTACSGGSWGKSAIYDKEDITMLNTSTLRLRFFSDLANNKYLYFITKSGIFKNQLECQLSGMQPNFGYQHYSKILIPIPPLAEQQMIVEKLERILPLVEEYGKNEEKLSKLNETLPDKIKQSILQHAVQGKLVPQNPTDKPASELLKRIKAEKEQLIKEGKIKKEKPLLPITEDEIPFELPHGWEWARLRDLCEILNGYAFKSDSYVTKSNNQIIRLGNVKNNGLALETSPAYIPDTIAKTANNYLLKENDILVTLTGTRLKRDYFYTALVTRSDIEQFNLYLNQRVGCLRFYTEVNPKLLNIFLKSKLILDNIFEHETGTANQGNIGTGATGELLIPLPPLAEQQRIVTKVEELMNVVDKLKN